MQDLTSPLKSLSEKEKSGSVGASLRCVSERIGLCVCADAKSVHGIPLVLGFL
jgi:hypothetical protein